MISLFLIIIAAICNAIMDTLFHHYGISIFNKSKSLFWSNPYTTSWLNKYVDRDVKKGLIKYKILFFKIEKPAAFTDAWHFFKSLMIITIILSIVFYKVFFTWYFDFLILGIVWNLVFSLFYNKILIK